MVKVELKMFKTLKLKVQNFVHLDENESLFSCKILCFCFIGLCKSQHSIKFKIYQTSTALSLIVLNALLICNLFSLKEKTFNKFIHDWEFVVYDLFLNLKVALVFVKLRKIKELVEGLSDKAFGWDKKKYLEMRRRNYAKNVHLLMVFGIFEACAFISFVTLPLFNQVQLLPLDLTIPFNLNSYPKLFWIVYILIWLIISFVIMMLTQIHHLSGCLFSYLKNEFEILGERYEILFDGLEDNIQNDKHELLDEIEKSLKENTIQHQKLLK